MIKHDGIEDCYENIENYATVPINLSSSIFKEPVSKQCITLATNLEKFKEVSVLKIYHLYEKKHVTTCFVNSTIFYRILMLFKSKQTEKMTFAIVKSNLLKKNGLKDMR